MQILVTDGIKVSIITEYQDVFSDFNKPSFAFSYRVKIENNSEFTVQLLRRHWYIYNANGSMTEVEGEGVIGEQPVIEPGASHEYISGCQLPTPMGKMVGNYLMNRLLDNKKFYVMVPEMHFVVPYLLN